MKLSATPVANACDNSAASTCTGTIPNSSANVAVAELYERNLIPCVSAEELTALLK